jgi:tryptophan 2,3-dioxygenase
VHAAARDDIMGAHPPIRRPPLGAMTYRDYLCVGELLDLQRMRSEGPEHDEMLFIVVHQVYELWFKQVLHELDQLVRHMDADQLDRGQHQLKRVRAILKTMVGQLDVLETMTPLEFLSFRDFLGTSSGFESGQFRELEYRLGHKDPDHLGRFLGTSDEERLRARLEQPSVWDSFLGHLSRAGFPVPAEVLDRPVEAPTEPSEAVQDVLIDVYRHDAGLSEFCELLTDMDEGLQEWRYRHVMMVQRTIGTKRGTGGSDGVAYLRSTLFQPVFPDLWEIRSRL